MVAWHQNIKLTLTIRSQEDALEEWKEWNLKRSIWHLDGRRLQKSGFLPILGASAGPLLGSAADAISSKL